MIEVAAIVLVGLMCIAMLVVAYAIVRHTNDAHGDREDRDLLRIEKFETWIEHERTERAARMKDERDAFDSVKKSFYGTVTALEKRATSAEVMVLNQTQQIHALLGEREFRDSVRRENLPQPEANGMGARAVRGIVATAIPDDNAEGSGDGLPD